ncbi:hypothetical protein P0D69_28015 [Paraburkholderia sediminicola]|uniref:hypothetical protein n=1 Tax=Paraburkholderia sediminicola TaxID=458836 RepID=UPI0038B75FC4
MTAFVKYSDILYLQSSQTWDGFGRNYIDNRTQWFNVNNSNVAIGTGSFTIPGGATVPSQNWVLDSGANTLATNMREARAFCLQGKITFTFTGATLIVRLNTDYGWGTGHQVFIDGKAPLSITGVLSGTNTLSCDSAAYGLEGPGYVDVVIADGLAAGSHTCSIYVNQKTSSSLYFSTAGFKVAGFTSQNMNQGNVWIMPPSYKLQQNMNTLTLMSKSTNTILNPSLAFPGGLVNGSNQALTNLSASTITQTSPMSATILPAFSGNEVSGPYTYGLTLSALYPDPNGTVAQGATSTLAVGNSNLAIHSTKWFTDNGAPNNTTRIFCSAAGSTTNSLSFTFTGDSLTITVQQDYGYGILGIYLQGSSTAFGTITCNNSVGQAFFTKTFTGFGTGSHTVYLYKTTTDTSKYVVFISASWQTNSYYSQITETVNVVMNASQPVAMPVQNVAENSYSLTYNPPVNGTSDLVDTPVRLNQNISYTEVLQRFPTYAVCYQAGYANILSQYDILIVDPFSAKASDVLNWQAMGIKVYGYISMGEEDGFYSNRYDFQSANAPYPGNKAGPGGTASYYMKGGFQARECNECTFDNQAIAGTKSCAQGQPMFFLGTGRCSKSCSYDNVNGYTTWSTGGACGGGFTSANNWQRPSADQACANTSCPKYKPVHSLQTGTKCPKYQQADAAYLQDFSIATPGAPDQNGVWGAWYTNQSTGSGWFDRIMSYYVPTVLNGPVAISNETVTVKNATTSAGAVLVFDTAQFPVDESATITLTTMDGTTGVYEANRDFSFDMKTGAFVFNSGITPAVTAGQSLLISYVKKGHHMDGIFMDTIDDADVYPGLGNAMSSMINQLKASTNANLISNRGFSNLNNYIKSCQGVMFESWLTDWNEDTGAYYQVTDADSLEYNEQVNAQLRTLRQGHVFDVYSLNYCNADSSGDALRTYCSEEDRKRGYLSWTSTIDLNNPAGNTVVSTPDQRVKTNAYVRFMKRSY